MNDGIGEKVRHVKSAQQDRRHECHWPGCARQVAPARWGCAPHWYALPIELRQRIWNAYRPGQEKDARPSREYIEAARDVQEWIAAKLRATTTPITNEEA
jgi:hypothetical protein